MEKRGKVVKVTAEERLCGLPPLLSNHKKGKIVTMTAAEKTCLANFLDITAAVTGSGYRSGEREYHFTDDGDALGIGVADASGTPVGVVNDDSLEQVADDVRACTACGLCSTRKNAVPGEGVSRPLVMVIGEGPGADEDATGRPFVGKAGQLLDKMLASIDLSRETNCFIGNVIKCRPPGNRDPQPDERAACAGFLQRQIQLLQPRFILCAGRISAQSLLDTTESIGRLRGRCFNFNSGGRTIPLFATYHPSALLRNEDLKRPAWEDLKLLRSELAEQNS